MPVVNSYEVCGVPIAPLRPEEAAEEIIAHVVSGRSLAVHLCNAYTLSLVDSDPQLRQSLREGDMNCRTGRLWHGRT